MQSLFLTQKQFRRQHLLIDGQIASLTNCLVVLSAATTTPATHTFYNAK